MLILVLVLSFSTTSYAIPFNSSSFDDNYDNYNIYDTAICSNEVITSVPVDVLNVQYKVVYLHDGTDYYYIVLYPHSAYDNDNLVWSPTRMALFYNHSGGGRVDYAVFKYTSDGYIEVDDVDWTRTIYNDDDRYMAYISNNQIHSFCVAGINGELSDYGGLYITNPDSLTGYSNITINEDGSLVLDGEELGGDTGDTGDSEGGDSSIIVNALNVLIAPFRIIISFVEFIIELLESLLGLIVRIPDLFAGILTLFTSLQDVLFGFIGNNNYGSGFMTMILVYVAIIVTNVILGLFGGSRLGGGGK
jgi:hypothetical protein